MVRNCTEFPWRGEISCNCPIKRANYFINSEEKCRKYFTPSRSLLYNLHLDLPRGRERLLTKGLSHVNRVYYINNPHIAEITTTSGFYDVTVYHFLLEMIDVYSYKIKILKWLMKMTASKKTLLSNLPTEIARKFVDLFYPAITNPELFKNFILHLNIIGLITKYEDPGLAEHLLYYAHQFGRTLLNGEEKCGRMIHICIFQRLFKNVSPILKYMNAPKFDAFEYSHYTYEIFFMRPDMHNVDFDDAVDRMQEERLYLIMQLVWMYLKGYLYHSDEVTLEVIRLIWCSVPDPFISFQEMMIFEKGLSAEELKRMYNFYTRAIGESHEVIKPRSLQHLCRTVIRRTLRENHHWIPEGIRKTGLPKPFHSFLNLEKTFVTCEL